MNWKKAIGFGIALWLIMFAIISGAVAWGVYGSVWAQVGAALIAGAIALILAYYVEIRTPGAALGYGASWAVISLVLNYVISARFDPTILSSWPLWLGYALILFVPLLRINRMGHARQSVKHGVA